MVSQPRISFGLIVLNGEPFLRYNLRALYPFAHQIIIVEGAVLAAAGTATADGHSTDGTLAELKRFKAMEDPEGKIEIIERDGFWSEKLEQSQAYASRATGDYLWQVDVDEFYQPADMAGIIYLLNRRPEITQISFPQITFWARPDYITDGWYLRRNAKEINRIFKWGPGFLYRSHRPPVVVDSQGNDCRELAWVRAAEMAQRGIYMYHYSLIFPQQVRDKCAYYQAADWVQRDQFQVWAAESFFSLHRPYRVHNVYHYPSWLERYTRLAPPQIERLFSDIQAGELQVELRPTADIEVLLASMKYRIGRLILKILEPPATLLIRLRRSLRGKSARDKNGSSR